MLSLDGFRYDYAKKFGAKNLLEIARNGVSTEGLTPIFPSKTFPNHYSIVTGLTAENHGLVSNHFYDQKSGETYSLRKREQVQNGKWYGGTPLWVAARKQGMVTASYFWVGTEAKIQGTRPHYYFKYNHSTPNEERVAQVIKWLQMPEKKRPHYITLYFSIVDSAGHKFGPDASETQKAVLEVDRLIGKLRSGMKSTGLPINFLISSDHGMSPLSSSKTFYLDDCFKPLPTQKLIGGGSFAMLYLKNKSELISSFNQLKKCPHLDVYTKQSIPKSLSYSNSSMIGDIILSTHPPYYMLTDKKRSRESVKGGTHGYDPAKSRLMDGIFYAEGPNLNKTKLPRFQNIHIYPLVLKILGLKTLTPIDGDYNVLKGIYRK